MEVHTVTVRAERFTCNAYLAPDRHPTLVDAGAYPDVVDAIREYVDALETVVVTHQHRDHVAELDAVLDAFDADLLAYDGHPRLDRRLSDGDVVDVGPESFEVVYTPGHADDHVALVSERTLFSGDVVVHDDGAFEYGSFGRTDRSGQSRERLVESLRELLDRMPDTVEYMYAGHGGTFRGDVRDVVETALRRAERGEPKYPNE